MTVHDWGVFRIHQGDCRETLRSLPDASVHCCVTSPPYFGLRDYGHAGQIGLEPSPDDYVEKMVAVFREVRRVLRDDGTLWLNLGDTYSGGGRGGNPAADSSTLQGSQRSQEASMIRRHKEVSGQQREATVPGRGMRTFGAAKPKELLGIPWRVAFALQADGWYLRQDIIWHKPNPMPESVRDRCTKAHEYLFLLSKSERYYFDSDAMQEPATGRAPGNRTHKHVDANVARVAAGDHRERTKLGLASWKPKLRVSNSTNDSHVPGANSHGGLHRAGTEREPFTRNRRSVWSISTKPFREAHFATFPPDLVEPCVLAGSPPGGVVLDPFGGAGTTALAATQKGRSAILCELNPEYVSIAVRRVATAIFGAYAA